MMKSDNWLLFGDSGNLLHIRVNQTHYVITKYILKYLYLK